MALLPIDFEKDDLHIAVTSTPQDITFHEIWIECFFPADAVTKARARELASVQ